MRKTTSKIVSLFIGALLILGNGGSKIESKETKIPKTNTEAKETKTSKNHKRDRASRKIQVKKIFTWKRAGIAVAAAVAGYFGYKMLFSNPDENSGENPAPKSVISDPEKKAAESTKPSSSKSSSGDEASKEKKLETPVIGSHSTTSDSSVEESKVPKTSEKASEPQEDSFFTEVRLRNFLNDHLPDISGTRPIPWHNVTKRSSDGKHVTIEQATTILEEAVRFFENMPKMVEIEGTTVVSSDFHGSSGEARESILRWLNTAKTADERSNYLDLGDSSDRSDWGLETLLSLIMLKCTFPNKVTILRGNHECQYGSWLTFFRAVSEADQELPKLVLSVSQDEYEKEVSFLGMKGFEEKYPDFIEALWNILDRFPLVAKLSIGNKKIVCTHAAVPYFGFGELTLEDVNPMKIGKFNKEFKDYNLMGDITSADYKDHVDRNDAFQSGRGMKINLQEYEETMKSAGFDISISGHQHTNTSPIVSNKFPILKVCSQPFNSVVENLIVTNRAEILLVEEDGLDQVKFSRKCYEGKQWCDVEW